MSKRVYAALLAILIMAGTGFAQNKGSVTGKITDKQTNEELIGANILVCPVLQSGLPLILMEFTVSEIWSQVTMN